MSSKNPVNRPLGIVSSLTCVYGWYINSAKDALSFWIMGVLSLLYLAYIFFEYFTPSGFGSSIKLVTKFAKYGLIAITSFLLLYCVIFLVAPTFAQNNETLVGIYNPKKLTQVQEEPIKKPFKKTKSDIQTWNEIIDGKDSCNATPLIVKDIDGITENKAREFLSRLPHLNNRKRQANLNRNAPYLYWHTWTERETWNKDEEYAQEVRGMAANYNQIRKLSQRDAKTYANDFYKQILPNHQKTAFLSYNIKPDSPYIVLYHDFESANRNQRYEKRFKTYQTSGYHIFIFREKSLDSIFNPNL